jgi:hypothetical protein
MGPTDIDVELTSDACTLQLWDTVEVRSILSDKQSHHQYVATIEPEYPPSFSI